jgi:hypothetical protein
MKLKHTVSVDADKIIRKGISNDNQTKGSSTGIMVSPNNQKLIGAVILALFLIYFLFLRGSKPKTDKAAEKSGKPKKIQKK